MISGVDRAGILGDAWTDPKGLVGEGASGKLGMGTPHHRG